MIGTGVRGTRGEDFGTSGSAVRKFTQAGETCRTIHTSALVQTGTGSTFIDVHLAEVTYQEREKKTQLYIKLLLKRRNILSTFNSPLGGATEPMDGLMITCWIMDSEVLYVTLTSEALATLAGEAVQLVNACASILARTWQTVIPVQVAVLPHPSRLAVTAVTGKGQQILIDNQFLFPLA